MGKEPTASNDVRPDKSYATQVYYCASFGSTRMEEAKVVENKQEANIEDVLQTLKAQLQEHQRQSEHHQTMAVKAQGALEVLLQLHPQQQEENNNK